MATIRENIHVYKIELSNYGKSYLLILVVHFTITIIASLCLYRIEECDNNNGNPYVEIMRTGYDICDLAKTLNVTDGSKKLKENLLTTCREIKNERNILKDELDRYNKTEHRSCYLDVKMFTKWFYFTHKISRFLGSSPGISLSNGAKVFLAFYYIVALLVTLLTYVICAMFINTTVKLTTAAMSTYYFKDDDIMRYDIKVAVVTLVLFIIFWLILSSLKSCYHTNISFSESTFRTLSEILTIDMDSDSFGQDWIYLHLSSVPFVIYILLYNIEIGILFSIMERVITAVISKRSGLWCVERLQMKKKKYNVTCPKCVMVEKELEYIKRMKEIKEEMQQDTKL